MSVIITDFGWICPICGSSEAEVQTNFELKPIYNWTTECGNCGKRIKIKFENLL